MADTGRQSPLGVNVLGSVLQNTGLQINSIVRGYLGISKTNDTYEFGSLVQDTVLRLLTYAINDAYQRGVPNGGNTVTIETYDNMLHVGQGTVPALGNSVPDSYVPIDPAGVWARTSTDSVTPSISELYGIQNSIDPCLPGPANSGYGITGDTDNGQEATWYPYTGDSTLNPNSGITQWGWLRCHARQAWNEFNWNGSDPEQENPEYKEFLSSFMTASGFVSDSNQSIHVIENSDTFLDGIYSNMNDLISSDISGVSLAGIDFGTDLENLGKVIDLRRIETFGMPSNLLMSIGAAGAMNQDLGLALIASGVPKEQITSILSGTMLNWSKDLEQQIFGAFLIITGENLTQILAPLQCRTQGLDTLADLLDVRKMFPLSYSTLTVPVYNAELGLPTNSKTYYLIYESGGINPALDTQEIQEYVGTIVPRGLPPTFANTVDPENYVDLPKGFNSYLDGIIPYDWALAAGALSFSLRQIKNIENLKFEVLAKVAKGTENVSDLPLVAGTSKPTDQAATDTSREICSLGSGQAGSYTMSDFFGSMSGLPYPWKLLSERLSEFNTSTLNEIYRNLFLTVTWEEAEIEVEYSGSGPYTVTGLTITNPGGGYGINGAPAPSIVLSNGGTATVSIGTDDTDMQTFGRVYQVTLTNPGPSSGSIPTATVEAPPIVKGGSTNTPSGTVGWPEPMNGIVQSYIDDANSEIEALATSNTETVKYINEYWNILGTQLAREQRARYTCLSPVSVPKDFFLNQYPNTQYNFLDSMPRLSQDTRPHMSAQTLEAISDLNNIGGQSIVAKMREERNQQRLAHLGTELDNNIPNTMSTTDYRTVIANGTIGGAVDGITSPNGEEYTIPAWLETEQGGEILTPEPSGYYLPTDFILFGSNPIPTGFLETESYSEGDITPIIEGDPNPVVGIVVPDGPIVIDESPIDNIVIIAPPPEYDPANLPPNLDPNYTSSTLLPSTLSIKAAIEKVIECNCDCWIK